MSKKYLTKKRLTKAKKELYADDKYAQDLLDDLYALQDELGSIKAVSKDELEKAKVALGMQERISKQAEKRQRREDQKKLTPTKKSKRGLKKFINKQLNLLLNSQWSFHYDGNIITVIDINKHHMLEHKFIYISSDHIHSPSSLTSKWIDVFAQEDRFINDINLKRDFIKKVKPREGQWTKSDVEDRENAYGVGADYNLMDGGAVNVPEATYRKFDMIPALLCANEFVFSQAAVRGAGKGSVMAGQAFLYLLGDHFEREAAKHAHKR